jgi:mono/diheme cytochrome c family protein
MSTNWTLLAALKAVALQCKTGAMFTRAARIRWSASAALLLLVASTAVRADDPRSNSKMQLETTKGAEVYSHVCQGCHMPTAEGAVGAGAYPKLASNPALASWQYIAITVLNGRKAMPPFGTPPGASMRGFRAALLTDAQVADVVNYVRSHFGNRYKGKVTAEQVAQLPHPRSES